jgi:hypothetical protein
MDYELVACNVQQDPYKTKVYLNDEALIFADGAIYVISDLSLSNPLTLSYVATTDGVPSDLEWLL